MVSKTVAEKLSEELHTTITLSSVNYSFFKRVQVRDLYVEDLHGDTLIYSELTRLRIKQLRSDRKGVEIKKITLENAYVNFVADSSDVINTWFIVERLRKPHVPPEKKTRVHIADIELIDSRFSLSRMVKKPAASKVNYSDMHFAGLQIKVKDLYSALDTIHMDITSLSGGELSGFRVNQLESHLTISKKHLHFNDLAVVTEGSDLHIPHLSFRFEDYQRFKKFSQEVDLALVSEASLLKIADLAYFAPVNRGIVDQITLDGKIDGKLSNLRGDDLFVTFDQNSTLAFDFVMIGLPEFNNTFINFHFRELSTSAAALHNLTRKVDDTSQQSLYPWINLGNLDFQGKFTGYPDDFVASGLLKTGLGNMIMDLSFEPDTLYGVAFNGHLRTRDFSMGEFLNQEKTLGQLDMNIFVDGSLYRGQIEADMDGTVDTLEFSQYAYSHISLDGAFTNKTFDGGFSISDPNIKLDFLGKMDFSGEVPAYKFTADVARARPYYLNLPQSDPNYFTSFLIETDLSGRKLDQLNGEVKLINSLFEKSDAQLQLYDMSISTRNSPDSSWIQVTSEMLNATMEGRFRLSQLPASFKNLADRFLDIIPNQLPVTDTVNHFTYQVDFRRVNPLLDFFLPTVQISEQSHLEGEYDPSSNICTTIGFFPGLHLGPSGWRNVDLFSEIKGDEFQFHFQSDSMTYGKGYSLVEQQFSLLAANDTAHLEAYWDNRIQPRYQGELKITGTYTADSLSDRGFVMDVNPSDFHVNNELWKMSKSSLLIKDKYIHVDSLAFRSEEKHLLANGTISSWSEEDFDLEVKNMDLNQLSSLAGINMEFMGHITGNLNYKQMDGNPYINTALHIDTLHFNDQLLGPTYLNAAWNDVSRTIHMKMVSEVEGIRILEGDGDYYPSSQALDFDIHTNRFQLNSLNRYTRNIVSDLEGAGNVSITVDGTLQEPELNGTISFDQGAATISFLNTRYMFNDQIRIYNNNFYLENFSAQDETGNLATINGTLSNSYLKDFYTNLHIDADNLLCMDTESKDNDVFYGTIYATAGATLNGRPNAMKLDVNANTGRNTAIYLHIFNASEVQTTDFITFLREEELQGPRPSDQAQKIGGLEMNLEVDVTPDAVVQLIFDPKVGDIIETSGRGDLRIMVDPASGFSIFGDVELIKGDYLFTLQNVINKRFQIEPGGMISFNGSPTGAAIDLNAIYTTRAAPYNLYPGGSSEAQEKYKKRIPVECNLYLQGELQAPTISTGITLPTADPQTRDLLVNSTSTEEELMRQFLSLLVINNFYSVTGMGSLNVGTMSSSAIAGVTASELLSNQLSNWLSQISDDFDIGVSYRPGDQINSDEVEVALSTQLLDDRIIITGNVDMGGQETNPSIGDPTNPYIMGDFDVEFKVTDNVSVIAFNRARDEIHFETGRYKQGVGVSYREEFDDFPQLISRYREGLTNRKKKKKKSATLNQDE